MFEESIVLGVITSYIFYELVGIIPGGIIVPGYLSYYSHDPERIIFTLFIALLSYIFVYYFLSRYIIIYGIRRFFLLVLSSYLFGILFENIFLNFYSDIQLTPIGFLIGGIIANNFVKQGIVTTLLGLGSVFIIVEIISLYLLT